MSSAAKQIIRERYRILTPAELAFRKKRVDAAMNIVGDAVTRRQVEEALVYHYTHLVHFPRPTDRYLFEHKGQKIAAKSLARAIRRLEYLLNDREQWPITRDSPVTVAALQAWREKIDKSAEAKLVNKGGYDKFKRHAVKAAAAFCQKHNLPLKASRHGVFCRLAPLFYRGIGSNFYQLCREHLRNNHAGSE